jgi:ERCC4-type nuclease
MIATEQKQHRTLPALKSLGKLADVSPTVVVDSREQDPLCFVNLPSCQGSLVSGDYSFLGGEHVFSVERKTIPDIVSCCADSNRQRFERELIRLRGYRFKRLLIVGSLEDIRQRRYRSKIEPRAVLNSIRAFEVRYDIPVVFEPRPDRAAALVESWVWFYARDLVESCNGILRAEKSKNRV